MDHKEKSIFIGGEIMVKCATVKADYIGVFLFYNDCKKAESMLDVICIYIYLVL